MNIADIILKKAAKEELSFEELKYFIDGVADDSIEDFKITALISAIYINGLSDRELTDVTLLMAKAGDMLDLSQFEHTLDKHSTGGVGDKVSLIVTPVIAAFGITVAKMSGRGLSYTGGTIDKLESINGFNVNLKKEEFFDILGTTGCAITSQTGNMCYADKRIYALRDLTGLVDSIPLIASSIMSKKLAAGAENIILDVKCGKGAFMKDIERAELLSKKMIAIGSSLNKKVTAIITDMNNPLGYCVGNSLEVIEAVKVLKGEYVQGLSELCREIIVNALLMTNKATDRDNALTLTKEAFQSGKGLLKFKEFIKSQGGDTDFIDDYSKLPLEKSYEIKSECSGYIKSIDSLMAGEFAMLLGGGRKRKEDIINYGVGIEFLKKSGDYTEKGETLAKVYAKEPLTDKQIEKFRSMFEFSNNKKGNDGIILRVMEGNI